MRSVKVLAFTASSHRPAFLRSCMLQMQAQTYGLDHGIFLNSPQYHSPDDGFNYLKLVDDIVIKPGNEVLLAYGKQGHQHFNHMRAISQFDVEQYDLFLKIDDDDVYRCEYVHDVVDDFKQNRWDFSASFSDGIIKKDDYQVFKKGSLNDLIINDQSYPSMPGTYAFSRSAIQHIIRLGKTHKWDSSYEDPTWVNWMQDHLDFVCAYREKSSYVYFVHGDNYSTRL